MSNSIKLLRLSSKKEEEDESLTAAFIICSNLLLLSSFSDSLAACSGAGKDLTSCHHCDCLAHDNSKTSFVGHY